MTLAARMSSAHRRPYVFDVNDHILSSPNSKTIPPFPLAVAINSSDPRETMKTRWADDRYPGLPFVPLFPRFDSEPFCCLKPPRDVFPIEGSGSSWRLAGATARSFQALEHDLCLIERSLRTTPEATFPLPSWWTLFHLPETFGYMAVHKTYDSAQTSALKSRDAFLPLMGWCSFLISHFHEQIPHRSVAILRWENILTTQAKLSLDYIQVIKASELTDFSVNYQRAGVVIEHFNSNFQCYVSNYIKCNVPVWIHWGEAKCGRPAHHGILNQYLPLNTEVSTARQFALAARQVAAQVTMDVDRGVVENVGTARPLPEPERNSRQKRGELWHEFFTRMDRSRLDIIAKESSQAMQARLAKEKAQAGHPLPGQSSRAPTIYEWEEDIDTGFLLRKIITRSYARDIWDTYSKSQRRYDSIRHEWDLCTALNPDPPRVIVADTYEDTDSDDEFPCTSPKFVPVPKLPVPSVDRNSIASPTTHKSAPAVTTPPLTPAEHNDIHSCSTVPVIRDHVSPVVCHEYKLHSPAAPPSSDAQDDEIMVSDPSPSLTQPPTSAGHDGIPSSESERVMSSPSVPLPPPMIPPRDLIPSAAANSPTHDHEPMVTDPLTVPPPVSSAHHDHVPSLKSLAPTIPLSSSIAENEGHMSPAQEAGGGIAEANEGPLAAIDKSFVPPSSPVPHELVLTVTSELSPLAPTIPLSPCIAENEGHKSPAQEADGVIVEADEGPSVADEIMSFVPPSSSPVTPAPQELVSTVTTSELSPIAPSTPLSPSVAGNEEQMSPTQEADGGIIEADEGPSVAADEIMSFVSPSSSPVTPASQELVSTVTTSELSPIAPTIPLSPPVAGNEEQMSPAQEANEGIAEADEDDDALSVVPGRNHALIYDGSPAPLLLLSFTDTLSDDVYGRYGFIGSPSKNVWQSTLPWSTIRKILGDVETHVEDCLRAPISQFLEGLLLTPRDPLAHLASFWDLAVDSVSPLVDHINPRFRLVVRSAGSDVIYFIEARNHKWDGVCWQLMLSDAATVLECFRQEQASSVRDLALFLFRRGTPFSTRIRRSEIQSRSSQRPVLAVGLGWRSMGHKPTVSEYNFYENLRRAFFNHPRSRSAHLKGGIIWRHALESSGVRAEEDVLGGPSEQVLACGVCIGSSNDAESLWDDDLSDAEMNLICGVYKYEAGETIIPIIHFRAQHLLL